MLVSKLLTLRGKGRDFSGGPKADSTLAMEGAQVRSLVGELDPTRYNY